MPHDLKKSVWDAWNACQLILEFIKGHSLETYRQNARDRSAVERQFIVLGEAFNRISEIDPSFRDRFSEMGDAIGMRNHIAHGYDRVSDEVIWFTAVESVPVLMDKLSALLDNNA